MKVEGNVYNPGLVAYIKGLPCQGLLFRLEVTSLIVLKRNSYVIKANGEIDKANIFLGRTKRLSAGDTVVVPVES